MTTSPINFSKSLIIMMLWCLGLQAQTWTQLADFAGHSSDDGAAFVIGDKAYCGSGLLPWFAVSGDFRVLNMTTDTWSTMAGLPNGEHRQYAVGFSSKGKGYVFGGVDGSKHFRSILEYNPTIDTWTRKTSLPDSGISGAVGFVIKDMAYIVCGRTAQKPATNTVWAYDIMNDSWQQKANFPFGNKWRASGASLNGKGYLIFGADSTNNLQNGFYEYDPTLDSWTSLPSFPGLGRNYSSLTAIKGQLVVFGGIDSIGVYQSDLWRYEPASQVWHQQKSLPAKGRKGGVAFTDGTALYYTMGIDSNNTRLNETWKCANPLISAAEFQPPYSVIYPNPFDNIINVNVENNGATEIRVTSITGQALYHQTTGMGHHKIDLTHMPGGVYLVTIKSLKGTSSQVLIKQ
jgi:N-acetylneuraminic acid mutarotase